MHGDAEQDTRPSPDQRVLPHFGIMASDPTSWYSLFTLGQLLGRDALVLSDVAIR